VQSRDSPFFLFVNYLEPHIQYRPPEDHAQRLLPADAAYEAAPSVRQRPCAHTAGEYELTDRDRQLLRALYRGELSYVDDAIARLREALKAQGEWRDTIMIIVGDHGENIGDHGFLGHQYNIYDTLLHVPMVIPGGAFTGTLSPNDQLIQLCDLAPTVLDETGVEDAELREQSQGQSFHPSVTARRSYAFSEYLSPQPIPVRPEFRSNLVGGRNPVGVSNVALRTFRGDGIKSSLAGDILERL
jgi:arylsulfatase A-like enzyme